MFRFKYTIDDSIYVMQWLDKEALTQGSREYNHARSQQQLYDLLTRTH